MKRPNERSDFRGRLFDGRDWQGVRVEPKRRNGKRVNNKPRKQMKYFELVKEPENLGMNGARLTYQELLEGMRLRAFLVGTEVRPLRDFMQFKKGTRYKIYETKQGKRKLKKIK